MIQKFEEIVKRLNAVNERRNQIIHSYWTYDLKTLEDSTLKLKANSRTGRCRMTQV
jgi:uncharacterized protein YutE (UPF0331/DUF86 family)